MGIGENISGNKNTGPRDAILASIRASLAASAPFDAAHRAHHSTIEVAIPSRPELSREILIANFKESVEFVGGKCLVTADHTEAAAKVTEIIEAAGAMKIAVSDSDIVKHLVADKTSENTPARELFDFDLGITSAQWGIAETGTLVLESEKESHRLTSLVPPVHLCILRASDIRQTLGEILELTSRDLSRAITFITGASRTSDIELTLAIGVHGPGELYVIVIADQ
jgi:L-lactate dehydrogenase complex protein LldG